MDYELAIKNKGIAIANKTMCNDLRDVTKRRSSHIVGESVRFIRKIFLGVGLSFAEEQVQNLFRYFCQKIAIAQRENVALQQQMLPLRFRPDMVEFP